MKKRAIRNITLCTKDCLCLYVCPTLATDTETGQIDATKCIGCGECANSCPSHAISLVPYEYPEKPQKALEVINGLNELVLSKNEMRRSLLELAAKSTGDLCKFYKALALSQKISSEDIIREANYLNPLNNNVIILLDELKGQYSSFQEIDELSRLVKKIRKRKVSSWITKEQKQKRI